MSAVTKLIVLQLTSASVSTASRTNLKPAQPPCYNMDTGGPLRKVKFWGLKLPTQLNPVRSRRKNRAVEVYFPPFPRPNTSWRDAQLSRGENLHFPCLWARNT